MAKALPDINYPFCMACRVCVIACPFGCLDMTRTGMDRYGKAYPELVNPETCTGCGICARECPVDAIEMAQRS